MNPAPTGKRPAGDPKGSPVSLSRGEMVTAVRAALKRSEYCVRLRRASDALFSARERLHDLDRLQRLNLAKGFREGSVRTAVARHDRVFEGASDGT